jgi:hypothetical protein
MGTQRVCSSQEEIGIGFGEPDLIPCDHGRRGQIDAESLQGGSCRFQTAAGGNRPGNLIGRQCRKKGFGPWQRAHVFQMALVRRSVQLLKTVDAGRVQVQAGLPEQHVREEPAAHPNPAVHPPHGQCNPFRVQRFAPREHVLIHAVHEGAVEIEQEGGGLGRRLRGCHHNKPFGLIDGRASTVKGTIAAIR